MTWPETLLDILSLFLTVLSPPDVFLIISNLYAKSRLLSGLQVRDSGQVAGFYSSFEGKLAKYCPKTWEKLWSAGIQCDSFLTGWLESLFVRALRAETVLRVWDVFLVEGDEVLLKVALALVLQWESEGTGSIPDFLQRGLYQPSLTTDTLFNAMKRIKVKVVE